jgi:hypothetical protein
MGYCKNIIDKEKDELIVLMSIAKFLKYDKSEKYIKNNKK